MYKYYITVGFMGSGSSAITDFLTEFDQISNPNGSFEYVFLHAPDGLFDLEDKLLIGNNALRSDEAIHRFLSYMEDLYSKKHFGVAGYNQRVSTKFYDFVNEFISDLNPVFLRGSGAYWHYKQNPDKRMTLMRAIRKAFYFSTLKKILLPPPQKYKGMIIAFPSEEEFYAAAQSFIYKVMDEIKKEKKAVVLDQMLLPHNLFRFKNYFRDDTCAILVSRDPRDVFISNKYFWAPQNVPIPFPTDVNEFCRFYKGMRKSVQNVDSPQVIEVKFEDLVYKYDSTLEILYSKLQLNPKSHTEKKKLLNPERSIINTNLKYKNSDFASEAEIIENELPEYLYDFPNNEYMTGSEKNVF